MARAFEWLFRQLSTGHPLPPQVRLCHCEKCGRRERTLTVPESVESGPEMLFALHVRNDNRDRTPRLVNLKAVCGPRDIADPQPAITVMLPDED